MRAAIKNKEIGAYFELETRLQALQNTVILNSKVYISKKASNKNYFYKKSNLKQKNWATSTKKQLKTVIYMCHSVKNYFSKSKSHSLNAAHGQKTSLAQKKIFHTAIFLTFAFRSKQRLNE